jgi:hypothetical protein
MLIKYQPKNDHIKCVPLIPVTDEQKKYNMNRDQVQLLPGTNEVTDNEWAVMKMHLTREIARKEITVIEAATANGRKVTGGKAHNITDVLPSKAIALVAECVNPDTLIKWHKEETREEIRLAIVEKMKELKMEIPKYTPEAGDEEEEGDDKDGKGDKDPENEGDPLDKMTVEALKAYAAERNIAVSGNKAEILAAIKTAEGK